MNMELESDLGKAFYGVYNSSREIVRNNQRNLFCNMLDLLSRTIKTIGEKCSNMEEFMIFWTSDILPLVFDEDKEIQRSAITAMEVVASTFQFKFLHSSFSWNEIKTKIVQDYSKRIYTYRESSNSHWFRIWCILIRILDKEIMKGASTINTFLSIVELGFRSSDYNVRIEAFYCWKVLIEIFANNGEICSPKRIRLICIPLKSSHSKTSHAAVVKLKVWWFLITKVNENIKQHMDTVLQPFFTFCYGLVNRNNICAIDFKTITTLCMLSLLGTPSKALKKRMEQYDIECLSQPLIDEYIMDKSWNVVLTCTTQAIKDSYEINSIEDECSELLIRFILTQVLSTRNVDIMHFLFEKLPFYTNQKIISDIQKCIKCEEFQTCIDSINNDMYIGGMLCELCRYVIPSEQIDIVDIVEEIVCVIFRRSANQFKNVFNAFLSGMLSVSTDPISNLIEIWKVVSNCLIKCFDKYQQNDSVKNLLTQWIIWPLKVCLQSREPSPKDFDDQFKKILQSAFELKSNVVDKVVFVKEVASLFQKSLDLKVTTFDISTYFIIFMRAFVTSYMLLKYDVNLIATAFELLKVSMSRDINQMHIDLSINYLKALILYMEKSEIDKYIEDIKDVWSHIVNYKKRNNIQSVNLDNFRRQLLDDLKNKIPKETLNKIKNCLASNDVFVIIPAIWSLNPEKLTTRQREKLLEKSDNIPALYNDMSQSQDAFIKPWTPKKIVISKGRTEEIAIDNTDGNRNDVVSSIPTNIKLDDNISLQSNNINVETDMCKSILCSDIPSSKGYGDFSKPHEIITTKVGHIEREDIQEKQHLEELADPVEAMILKDTSSPPDRKQTNNSTSPLLKPKTTHLTGRGAQLINMIRNKKHESYNSKPIETSTPISKLDQSRERDENCLNWSCAESDLKPSPMNLLVFSKTLPSPCASPSASILKRKHPNDSIDDVYYSQAYKRKRVSFHDPPVSVTKEYLRDEEIKNSSKRCLQMDQEIKGPTKHLLKRSGKIETQFQSEHVPDISGILDTQVKNDNFNLTSLDDNNSKTNSNSSMLRTPYPFIFKTEEDVLNFVINQFNIDDVCEKYLSCDKTGNVESNLSKFISTHMNVNLKLKSNMLETLAEKHSAEFLTYAIQENLSSTVCDRLSSNSVIDYISNKSLTNIACRIKLFEEIQNILSLESFSDERLEFIKKTITSKCLTDQELLDLIELLFENKRKHQRAVSESAIDSSSTL